MTDHPGQLTKEQALAARADGYITKVKLLSASDLPGHTNQLQLQVHEGIISRLLDYRENFSGVSRESQ